MHIRIYIRIIDIFIASFVLFEFFIGVPFIIVRKIVILKITFTLYMFFLI